jgi:hypothetical protein
MSKSNELSITANELANKETIEALMTIYEFMAIRSKLEIPDIEVVHNVFRENWINQTYEFLVSNADAYEFNLEELTKTNHIDKLGEVGFNVLNLDDTHNIFNVMNISFRRNGVVWNSAVLGVW